MYRDLSNTVSYTSRVEGNTVYLVSKETGAVVDEYTMKSRRVPLSEVEMGDIVRINDSDLDWLRDEYNANYNGEPMKVFSNKFAISILVDTPTPMKGQKAVLFVRALDDVHIQADYYQSNVPTRSIWTEVLFNVQLQRLEDGTFRYESCSSFDDDVNSDSIPSEVKLQTSAYINDVVRYILFFMAKHGEEKEVVRRVKEKTSSRNGNSKKVKKKSSTHRTVYVPNKIIRYEKSTSTNPDAQTSEKTQGDETTKGTNTPVSTDEKKKRPYFGDQAEWNVSGYTRRHVKKDGTVIEINVAPSVHRRNPEKMRKEKKPTEYRVKNPDKASKKKA